MSIVTACPLDCYDACEIIYEKKIYPKKEGHTQGFLCPHMNHYESQNFLQTPMYKGEKISMEEAIEILKKMLGSTQKEKILHYRSSGNFGLMQEVVDHFFASYGATLTDGSLCDGAGAAGIEEGRGSNKNMPLSEIAKSEVVIIWGRNPHTTSSHLLPLLKEKTLIVIDPVKTDIAKMADLHIQIKPHGDIYLAMLLTRFLHIEGSCDEECLENFGSEFDDFYELTQSIRIKAILDLIGVSLGQIGDILHFIQDKKVSIVVGVGVQKYRDGADVLRAIDAFAFSRGLFGKEGCGVAYLGNSQEGIVSPFKRKAKRVSKVDTKFEDFETVFVQGANPLSQMPNSLHVKKSFEKVANKIYFGLFENETSMVCDLVIPAKTFLAKNDIRASYSHHALLEMPLVKEETKGISEYDLAKELCEEFDIEIQSEEEYLKHFRQYGVLNMEGTKEVDTREDVPYQDGFDTDDGEFCFLEELDFEMDMLEDFFLITPKSKTSLNSQFKRDKYAYLHPSLGVKEGEEVEIISEVGSVRLPVKLTEDVRGDCVLIYSGTPGVNNITPSYHSYEGKSACFQDLKVKIKKD
ncbi:MAG: molybdopterin-dependent oxidoreductase [Epsilonproteobacteria bacterium]|nr:molybdopterin-dependent oxidoreductase [Campylobacterota bacterium]